MPPKDLIAVVDQTENFLTLQNYLIDSGIAGELAKSKALIVYLIIKRHARWTGPKSCFPSISRIAELAECGERAIYNALNTLKAYSPPLITVEKVTYRELRERGLLPRGYRASEIEINLYTILPISPTLPLHSNAPLNSNSSLNPDAPLHPNAPDPCIQMQGNNNKNNETKSTPLKKLAGDLINHWRKTKKGLLGNEADVTNREAKEIHRDLVKEYGYLGEKVLFTEISRFFLPKEKMTDLERECIEKGRTVGALRWMLQRKTEIWGERSAKETEETTRKLTDQKAKQRAQDVVKRNNLSEKIADWIHEELSPEPKMNARGRLTQWLEHSSGLSDREVDYCAKQKIERWAKKQIEKARCKRLIELKAQDKKLWATIVLGRLTEEQIRDIAEKRYPAPQEVIEAAVYSRNNIKVSTQPQGVE